MIDPDHRTWFDGCNINQTTVTTAYEKDFPENKNPRMQFFQTEGGLDGNEAKRY
ncbi:MAG: hypothetical protein ONB44_20420 [candidate division KSB1 bacterium]|nr:hypothetical protein [candidate division KSB1 bacterium]MDZ7304496.1 hypothetical protein [candidate division KSB1 bacterium]MDZ7313877.1 hypothetical protein [candidate division KSB1 bacterium]